MDIFLVYFIYKYNGNWQKTLDAINNVELIENQNLVEFHDNTFVNIKDNTITMLSSKYPDAFKEVFHPPFCFFYQGDINLLKNSNTFTLTGNYNDYDILKLIDSSLKPFLKADNDAVLVTSAKTIIEMKIALEFISQNKKIIFVIDNDIESFLKTLPELANCKNYLIISEYPKSQEDRNLSYIASCRLIASLSQKLIIYSLAKKKELFYLIDNFLDLGKDVAAFPNINNKKDNITNQIIDQGAKVITSITN